MNKTKIEWCDYTINPVKGLCPMACPYCYARAMYKRFKWNPEIRFDLSALDSIDKIPAGSRIFVGSTMELFGDWIDESILSRIFNVTVLNHPEHTFIFLTKQPQNLPKWSPFPENCWVGRTVTDDFTFRRDTAVFQKVKAKVKFISFEPLLRWDFKADWDKDNDRLVRWLEGINWLIIGACTGTEAEMEQLQNEYQSLSVMPYGSKWTAQPQIEWIQEIVEAADQAGIPVFLKDNLRPILPLPQKIFCTEHPTGVRWLRQDFPELK